MCWTYCWSHVLPTFLDFCCAFSYDPFGDKMSSTEVIFEKWPHNLCEPRQWSCFSWGINFTDPCLCFKHLCLMCDISLWRFSSDNHKYLKAYPHLQNAFLQKLPDIYIYILKKRTGKISIKPIGDFWIFFTKPFEIRHGRRRPYREFFEKMASWTGARTRDLSDGRQPLYPLH